ncbi:hypothetical protein D3C79_789410 [compost metagenome]
MAGGAAIGQCQGGITDLDHAATGTLGHDDAVLAQALDQWLKYTQLPLDNAGFGLGGAVQFDRCRALGAFGIAIEALPSLAAEAAGIHQLFLHQ